MGNYTRVYAGEDVSYYARMRHQMRRHTKVFPASPSGDRIRKESGSSDSMPSHSPQIGAAGFSLIELMIVVAVIGIISILAVPNFMRTRLFANETSAIASLRVIVTSEITYASTVGNGSFGSTQKLLDNGLIDAALGSGTKDGYNLTLTADGSTGFTVIAVPITIGSTGQRGFYADQTGAIRYTGDGSAPTQASPVLGTESAPEEETDAD